MSQRAKTWCDWFQGPQCCGWTRQADRTGTLPPLPGQVSTARRHPPIVTRQGQSSGAQGPRPPRDRRVGFGQSSQRGVRWEAQSPLLARVSEGRGPTTSGRMTGPGSHGQGGLIRQHTLTTGIGRIDPHSPTSSFHLCPQFVTRWSGVFDPPACSFPGGRGSSPSLALPSGQEKDTELQRGECWLELREQPRLPPTEQSDGAHFQLCRAGTKVEQPQQSVDTIGTNPTSEPWVSSGSLSVWG